MKTIENGIVVSRETYGRLRIYQELLLKWQPKINLIGPDTIGESWERHFVDSLQVLSLLPDLALRGVDFGTGAGFPGLVLAIAGATDMHLIESDAKKVAFLREVSRVTETKVSIHHCRIQDRPVDGVQMIFSRACSPLSNLLLYASEYVSRETVCYFHKGKNFSKELLDASEEWMFHYDIAPSITDTQGAIVTIKNLEKRGAL